MTKQFKVGDKVRITGDLYTSLVGAVGTIVEYDGTGAAPYRVELENGSKHWKYAEYIELITPKTKKPNCMTELESRIAELERQVAELKPKKFIATAVTPNQQRKATIERAKAFVPRTQALEGRGVHYIVNNDKRTVVALVYEISFTSEKRVRAKGIAKCAPDDVFNADIGKAIALGRALGLDVSEFENAPEPTEVVVGMVVKITSRKAYYGQSRKVAMLRPELSCELYGNAFHVEGITAWVGDKQAVILEDTEAQYA